jgi:hypothetical protein
MRWRSWIGSRRSRSGERVSDTASLLRGKGKGGSSLQLFQFFTHSICMCCTTNNLLSCPYPLTHHMSNRGDKRPNRLPFFLEDALSCAERPAPFPSLSPCPASPLEPSPRRPPVVHPPTLSSLDPSSTTLANGFLRSSELNPIPPPLPKRSSLEPSSPTTLPPPHPTSIPPSPPFQPRRAQPLSPPKTLKAKLRPPPPLPQQRSLEIQTPSTSDSPPTNPLPLTRSPLSSRQRRGVHCRSRGRKCPGTVISRRGSTSGRRERFGLRGSTGNWSMRRC